MAHPFYLAMTAAEFSGCAEMPERIAWMACHFSPYGQGLSNCPQSLPEGSLLIVNDRIPPQGHSPDAIALQLARQMETLQPDGLLLDFQQPWNEETQLITKKILQELSCSIAVSHIYAKDQDCAVFLPPPPIRTSPEEYFAPWDSREIWLEIYDQWETAVVTASSCTIATELPPQIPALPHFDEALRCRYAISPAEDHVTIFLHRSARELLSLPHPIVNYVGLYQEYGKS